MNPETIQYIQGRADSTLRGDSGSIHRVSCADIRKLLDEREALLTQCQSMLAYIEMKMAHHGNMNVEQIMAELERVKVYSEVSTAHHLGCSVTTRRVDLDAAREAIRKAQS